ncbi:MAG: flagellar biosynthesis anti-sigma factor FlgM [Phycisphaerales bacterium]|nr:flagellar biosynthesis anti-sigma factor FlgM [Phycisphaerales bacterium]
MSEISVIGNAVVGSVSKDTTANKAAEQAPVVDCVSSTCKDAVELSTQAVWLEKIHQLPEVRQNRIDAIKQAIADDTYLNDDMLSTAFDLLIEEVSD